jgi:hypothetical protein
MQSSMLKLLLAAVFAAAGTAPCSAQMASGYWVVGNAVAHACEIVTSNPVIDYRIGSFGTGPYQSRADADLARSTIGGCPKDDAMPAGFHLPEEIDSDEAG